MRYVDSPSLAQNTPLKFNARASSTDTPNPPSRATLQIPKSTDILDHIYSLPQPAQDKAQKAVRAIESEAMLQQEAQPGLVELIGYLESKGVRMGLCTRNFESVSSYPTNVLFAPIRNG